MEVIILSNFYITKPSSNKIFFEVCTERDFNKKLTERSKNSDLLFFKNASIFIDKKTHVYIVSGYVNQDFYYEPPMPDDKFKDIPFEHDPSNSFLEKSGVDKKYIKVYKEYVEFLGIPIPSIYKWKEILEPAAFDKENYKRVEAETKFIQFTVDKNEVKTFIKNYDIRQESNVLSFVKEL